MAILKAVGLVKTFGRRRVVDGVTLEVERGEIVGLLGPNGAGKTTTFHMMCGILSPDKGTVLLKDQDVTEWPMYVRAHDAGMGYLPQQSSVFTKLTAEQNLIAMMELLNFPRKIRRERCQQLLAQFNITHMRKTRAWQIVRRRTAAVGDRPLLGLQPGNHHARRTVRGNRSGDGSKHPVDHS